jgi:hypothetical protein
MLLWLGSIVFGVIAAAAMATYIRRTWQLIRADEGGSKLDQVLDGLDRIETRLHAMSARLSSAEQAARLLEESHRRIGD